MEQILKDRLMETLQNVGKRDHLEFLKDNLEKMMEDEQESVFSKTIDAFLMKHGENMSEQQIMWLYEVCGHILKNEKTKEEKIKDENLKKWQIDYAGEMNLQVLNETQELYTNIVGKVDLKDFFAPCEDEELKEDLTLQMEEGLKKPLPVFERELINYGLNSHLLTSARSGISMLLIRIANSAYIDLPCAVREGCEFDLRPGERRKYVTVGLLENEVSLCTDMPEYVVKNLLKYLLACGEVYNKTFYDMLYKDGWFDLQEKLKHD